MSWRNAPEIFTALISERKVEFWNAVYKLISSSQHQKVIVSTKYVGCYYQRKGAILFLSSIKWACHRHHIVIECAVKPLRTTTTDYSTSSSNLWNENLHNIIYILVHPFVAWLCRKECCLHCLSYAFLPTRKHLNVLSKFFGVPSLINSFTLIGIKGP